jgi:hypothetical protein
MLSTERFRLIAFAVLAAGATITSTGALAQKKYSISEAPATNSQYLQEHAIDVEDRPGHQVRVYEIRYEYPKKDLSFAGVPVQYSMTRGISDYVNWNGSFTTYSVYTMEDGSKVYSRATGTTQSSTNTEGQRAFKFSFVENFAGGTGKFKGMRGQMRGGGERQAGAKSLSQYSEGEYWFED